MNDPILKTLDPARQNILLIRHAERFEITAIATSSQVLLTEKGKQDAVALGQRLAGRFGPVRLYHSPVERCGQTAECISRGITEAGGTAVLGGALPWLGGDFIQAEAAFVDDEIAAAGITAFLRNWFDDKLPAAKIASPAQGARTELGLLARQLDNEPGLIIDVTHDWNIMLLLENYLGLRHEIVGMPPFLGCLTVSRENSGELHLGYGGKSVSTRDWQ
jgi:broad specificity phosphatase PhoE